MQVHPEIGTENQLDLAALEFASPEFGEAERWPNRGRLVRVSSDKLYLIDTDLGSGAGHEHTAIALEGVSVEFESWLRTIDSSWAVGRLLWDADSHGFDLEVAGVVLRRLSELGVFNDRPAMRHNRLMRVAIIGNVPQALADLFGDWDVTLLTPWQRSSGAWNQTLPWDTVGELVDTLVRFKADFVILVTGSSVLDALDLSFLRNLRSHRIPHFPVRVTSSQVQLGPLVDFDNSQMIGACSDCVAEVLLDADPDWAHLLAQLVFVPEPTIAPDMLRMALVEAGKWANRWWSQDRSVAELMSCQRVGDREGDQWQWVPVGTSDSCRHVASEESTDRVI